MKEPSIAGQEQLSGWSRDSIPPRLGMSIGYAALIDTVALARWNPNRNLLNLNGFFVTPFLTSSSTRLSSTNNTASHGSGALFIGPPGSGKTHTVKALINQLGRPCLYVKGFKSECATEQENIGLVFSRARMTTPCMIVLEDLDSMIDDENRSFFFNELDGFESNSGPVVLATTNHPDKLDPAISDRPSRFDRKYYFNVPAAAERLAYIEAWNKQLQPELRLSATAASEVVQQTENFSFAYLKELFVSSTMQWMTSRGELLNLSVGQVNITECLRSEAGLSGTASMDEIVPEQAGQLRNQMHALTDSQPPPSSPGSVWTTMARAVARIRAVLS